VLQDVVGKTQKVGHEEKKNEVGWFILFAELQLCFLSGDLRQDSRRPQKSQGRKASVTAAEAQKFIEDAEQRLFDLG